jgi:hypothetical protein
MTRPPSQRPWCGHDGRRSAARRVVDGHAGDALHGSEVLRIGSAVHQQRPIHVAAGRVLIASERAEDHQRAVRRAQLSFASSFLMAWRQDSARSARLRDGPRPDRSSPRARGWARSVWRWTCRTHARPADRFLWRSRHCRTRRDGEGNSRSSCGPDVPPRPSADRAAASPASSASATAPWVMPAVTCASALTSTRSCQPSPWRPAPAPSSRRESARTRARSARAR